MKEVTAEFRRELPPGDDVLQRLPGSGALPDALLRSSRRFPPEAKNLIMHATLSKGKTLLMASDARPGMPLQRGNDVWISINCDSLAEIENLFEAFSQNGTVRMALHDAFWGARFGMLTDQFGVQWMFNFELPKPA
jgi:uncharacterized glyoxalase superfamily protein PhnB